MSKVDKILSAMRANPAGDWRIEDVLAVCRRQGLLATPPRGGGSHYKIRRAGGGGALTVPMARPIKPVYIRALIALIDAMAQEGP